MQRLQAGKPGPRTLLLAVAPPAAHAPPLPDRRPPNAARRLPRRRLPLRLLWSIQPALVVNTSAFPWYVLHCCIGEGPLCGHSVPRRQANAV